MSENKFTYWLHKELQQQQKEKETIMARAIKKDGAMILDEAQKKHLLDLFNAGREVFDDFDIRFVRAWDLKQLEDLIDDMKDAFGIAPKLSEYKHDDGSDMPAHFQDHVWSDDSRAYKRKD